MRRRDLLRLMGAAAPLALSAWHPNEAAVPGPLAPLSQREKIRVAFLIGQATTVIDVAGPWEVFQDVMVDGHTHPFELFTVAPDDGVWAMTGGLLVKANYTFANTPTPHVIVVPAQRMDKAAQDWLIRASRDADITMSVCTGAFALAQTGLLNGLAATTHHEFWDEFSRAFPKIELRRGVRFVDNGRIATAAGLTSGIDLSLHVVARYLGIETAAATAKYLEHASEAWRST